MLVLREEGLLRLDGVLAGHLHLDLRASRRENVVRNRHNVARVRLYRHRSLQVNTRFSAFFRSTKLSTPSSRHLKFDKMLQIFVESAHFLLKFLRKLMIFNPIFLLKC